MSDRATKKPIIARTELAHRFGSELFRRRRLLLLAPRGGGARRLAREIVDGHFGARVTWLSPPNVPHCTEREYCEWLVRHGDSDAGVPPAGDGDRPGPEVSGFLELLGWLEARARGGGGEMLVVLRHDGGPLEHLSRLGDILRALIEESGAAGPRVYVLVAGQASVARLRYESLETSLFSGAPVRHVPPFSADEVARVIDEAGDDGTRWGGEVWRATGGLPGLVVEALGDRQALAYEAVTARLARSSAVRTRLRRRVADDDRARVPAPRHARTALAALREGRPVRPLDEVEDELGYAEVRLYYDGLVAAGEHGQTGFRCEAVRRAADELFVLDAGIS